MKIKVLEKNNLVLLIFIFGVFLFYNQSCDGVVFLEYINLKFKFCTFVAQDLIDRLD